MVGEKFEYKGNEYIVIHLCKVKRSFSGKWTDGVVYENKNGEVFCRSKNNFLEKFNKVKDS